MEIELGTWPAKRMLFGCLAVLALIGLALLGRGVTPVVADGPTVLTPVRWAAANLSRQARVETERLQRDASELRAFLASPTPPDPVQALLLAQRLYASHRQGTSANGQGATAGADRRGRDDRSLRQRRGAAGQAATALNDVVARIKVLAVRVAPAPEGALHRCSWRWPFHLRPGADGKVGQVPMTDGAFDQTWAQLLDAEQALRALAEGQVRDYAGVLEKLAHSLAPAEADARKRGDPAYFKRLTAAGWLAGRRPAGTASRSGWTCRAAPPPDPRWSSAWDVSESMWYSKTKIGAARIAAQAIALAVRDAGGDVVGVLFDDTWLAGANWGDALLFAPGSWPTEGGTYFAFLSDLWRRYPSHWVVLVTDGDGYVPYDPRPTGRGRGRW